MRVVCVDRSRFSLMKLMRTVKQIIPEAEIVGDRKSEKVLSLADSQKIDVLLTELDLGRSRYEGLELARKLRKKQPCVNIIFVTAEYATEIGMELIEIRASGYVTKPYNTEDIWKEFKNLRYPVE